MIPSSRSWAGETSAGAPVIGGLSMLVYQGVASFKLWTGKKAPVEVMMKAVRDAL